MKNIFVLFVVAAFSFFFFARGFFQSFFDFGTFKTKFNNFHFFGEFPFSFFTGSSQAEENSIEDKRS